MFELVESTQFTGWFGSLRDAAAKGRITGRLERMSFGQFGDVKALGNGINEIRLNFGPGYRIYFQQRGPVVVLLLIGGDKDTQARDIRRARQIADDFELRFGSELN
jgi:putative addiction module killer protein